MNKLSRVGIDLAKNVFQLHGVDRHGKAVWRRRLRRDNWLACVRRSRAGWKMPRIG
jgi:transposase